ncbi:MAG: hypothetical protein A2Y12_06165 [Planctomycetes bacterium GWF2_42_9]|nr:MAG: hypothetical protein A2Y12_06165 [Planctomycetes bacterium GWF2_42_9]HAL45684.1 hypothetical protein [Phycisphaerales bacterium]
MATVNKRVHQPQALTINAIAAGGLVTHNINIGYDDEVQNAVDGMALAFTDLLTEFVRGTFTTEDWVHAIELLTGTGTDVFYQRKSGTAEASGYIKHTITNPVIYKIQLVLTHRKRANVTGSYECKAADENDGIADLWTMTDSQAAPTQIDPAAGLEITACALGSLSIYHVTRLELNIEMPLLKASQDGDVGYTAVDAIQSGMRAYGSISFQDAEITTSQIKAAQLLATARASLVATVKQAQGASAKTLTIAGVKFNSAGQTTNAGSHGGTVNPDEFTANFIITNNTTTPLTIAGTNKIVTIS